MGMDMSAYVLIGKTEEGHNRYDFAPIDHFEGIEIVGRGGFYNNNPSFRLSTDIRKILHDALGTDFLEGYVSYSPEELEVSIPKLENQADIYMKNGEVQAHFDSLQLIEFFEVCVKNNYQCSGL